MAALSLSASSTLHIHSDDALVFSFVDVFVLHPTSQRTRKAGKNLRQRVKDLLATCDEPTWGQSLRVAAWVRSRSSVFCVVNLVMFLVSILHVLSGFEIFQRMVLDTS